jgi:hypothetical protein
MSFSSCAGDDDIFDDTASTVCDVEFGLNTGRHHNPHANGDFNMMRQLSSPMEPVGFLSVSLGDCKALLK